MKGDFIMSRAHSNKGRYFRFGDRATMSRFILMYRDLFTPYGSDKIRCRSYVKDKVYHTYEDGKGYYSRGHHDDNIVKMMECGYDILSDNVILVNLTPDALNQILKGGCFKKEAFGRNRSIYVYDEAV